MDVRPDVERAKRAIAAYDAIGNQIQRLEDLRESLNTFPDLPLEFSRACSSWHVSIPESIRDNVLAATKAIIAKEIAGLYAARNSIHVNEAPPLEL